MKRWLCYFFAIVAVAALSGKSSAGQEIGDLQPIQTVALTFEQGMVVIRTDTDNCGIGQSLPDAVADMEASASGKLFLETADYLLLAPECRDLVPAMMEYLRPSCILCMMEGQPELELVADFLKHHDPKVTMLRYRAGDRRLQTLITQKGRMELVS
mgnify:CR=1 FL=1|jgi:hypothetical protein